MKRSAAGCLLFWIFTLLQGFSPQSATAHGTAYRVLGNDPRTVTAEFYYSDKEPIRYAEILIFSPNDPKIEYQNGRTDRQGRFSFYPDTAGTWRIEVHDGMGHKVQASVDVGEKAKSDEESSKQKAMPVAAQSPPDSMFLKIILGLSLIGNMFVAAQFLNGKKKKKSES